MIWKFSVLAVLAAWLALFLTGSGVLVSTEVTRQAGYAQDTIYCRYFVATTVIEMSYWYSENNIMGKAICPRLVVF